LSFRLYSQNRRSVVNIVLTQVDNTLSIILTDNAGQTDYG
jgi:hypothetical protein